ncbi:MAG: Ig-like domain-containing protein [Thermoleophilia bacterium]
MSPSAASSTVRGDRGLRPSRPRGLRAAVAAGVALAAAVLAPAALAAPSTPTITASTPASPSSNDAPLLQGTSDSGTTVRLFTTSDCSGPEVGSGSDVDFGGTGIGVGTVPTDAATTFHATAEDLSGTSACSTGFTYLEDSTAPTGAITAPAANANVRGNAVAVSSNSADGGSGVQRAVFERSPSGANTWTQIGADDTTAPYGVTFDTTLVADGLYDLRVRTTDNAGNATTSATRTIRVDNTAPTGAITAPAANANVRGNAVAVSSNSADGGSGVQRAVFERSPSGANTWTQIGADDTTAPYGVTFDTTLVADGLYDLRVTTTDNAGNAFTSTAVVVRVDNTAPTNPTTFESPTHAPSDWSNDNTVDISIAGAADGGSGVDGYSVEWSTTLATDPDTVKDLAGTATSFTSPGLADGNSHYVHLRTVDKAGNWSATIHLGPFFVDTLEPTTSISFPDPERRLQRRELVGRLRARRRLR